MPALARVRRIDDHGISLIVTGDRPVDVCVDGRRVWTFWTVRDTERAAGPVARPWRHVEWPAPLRRYLDGVAVLSVRESATGQVLFEQEVGLGSGQGRIDVRDDDGVELGFDKSGKLVATFAGRSDDDVEDLLDATQAVLTALQGTGIEPFLAYGTLLGAVREGEVLGHDSDADLGYVSAFTDPVDVCRESFRVQRELNAQGWQTYRYSGAAFKVEVTEGERTRGLDVFGGFLDGGRLYLMGEVGTEFSREWVFPLTTATLSGRPMPVPAVPERLLEAMYGPSWHTPDPAFQFSTPARTSRALNDWFRGTQPGRRYWERRAGLRPPAAAEPSVLAKRAAALATRLEAEVLDIGAGRGGDSLWLARQGLAVRAYDFVPGPLQHVRSTAEREGLDLEVRDLNLTEWRSVLAEGALLAASPRPRVVLARHVLDATTLDGRVGFARLCSMALRSGGQVLADLYVTDDPDDPDEEAARPEWMLSRADPEAVATLLRGAGAVSVDERRLGNRARPTVRMVGKWTCR